MRPFPLSILAAISLSLQAQTLTNVWLAGYRATNGYGEIVSNTLAVRYSTVSVQSVPVLMVTNQTVDTGVSGSVQTNAGLWAAKVAVAKQHADDEIYMKQAMAIPMYMASVCSEQRAEAIKHFRKTGDISAVKAFLTNNPYARQ